MCRFTAYAGAPTQPGRIVFGGEHSLYRQSWDPRELLSGSVNADGYGVVWYAEDGPVRVAEARPIWYDDDLRPLLECVRSPVNVAALRNGTPGLPVDRASLLPMTFERWTFVLNGFVPDFRARHMRELRSSLSDRLYGSLFGVSDSETLLLLAVEQIEQGASLTEALLTTAARVLERTVGSETQLTMTLTDGAGVAAVRTSNVAATNSLYWSRSSSLGPEGIVLASEVLREEDGWTAVDPHSWIEFDTEGEIRHGAVASRRDPTS